MELIRKQTEKLKLLGNDFILLLQGHFISKFGTYLYDVSLIFWVKNNTEYASLISILLIAAHLPEILLAPFGGVIADIVSKKKIIVYSDLISGILLVSAGIIISSEAVPITVSFFLLFVVSMILGVINSLFNPAVSALIPDLVKKERLQTSNSLYNIATNSGKLMGQGLSGILYSLIGAPFLFILNGISFLFSSASESYITETSKSNIQGKKLSASWTEFSALVKEGFIYVNQNKALKRLMLLIAFYHFIISPIPILVTYSVSDTLKAGDEWTGIILAAFTIGVIGGLTFAKYIVMNNMNIKQILFSGIIISAANFLSLGFSITPIVNSILLLLIGFVIGVFVVNLQTIIQTISPDNMLGRIFGLFGTIVNAAFPIGYGFYGLLMDFVGFNYSFALVAPVIFIFNGLCLLIFILFMYNQNFNDLFKKAELSE